jgi:hypothetical protein
LQDENVLRHLTNGAQHGLQLAEMPKDELLPADIGQFLDKI